MNIKKFISIVVCVCFLFSIFTQNIFAYINSDINIVDEYKNNNLFSNKYGKITDINISEKNNISIINIQDLHSNYSAQINIKNILDSIQNKFNIKKIFVEGGYGKIDTSWLNRISDKDYRDRIINQLLLNGRLTGTEFFAYKLKLNNILFGLENEEIHKQNLNRLSQIFSRQNYFDLELTKIKSDIDFLSSKYFSKDNLYLNKIINKYNTNKIDSKEFYTKLKELVNKVNKNSKEYNNFISINFYNFININKYVSLSSNKINDKKVIKELKNFLCILRDQLSYSEYNKIFADTNNLTDINKVCFYVEKIAIKNNIDLSYNYSNLQQYVQTNKLLSSINPLQLIDEERRLLNNLRQAFSKDVTEYEISFLSDFYYTFNNYLKNKITSNNYIYFEENFEKFKSLYSKYSVVNRLAFLEKDFVLLNKYYSTNNLRNKIFLQNITNNIDIDTLNKNEKDVIIVVSGGYHTSGLSKLFQDRNISYMTITPNIEVSEQNFDDYYRNIIEEQVQVNINALSFALASSVSNVDQFNTLVISAIELVGAIYSKKILENIVSHLKPLVDGNVALNYSDKQSVISVGNRNIVLNNISGKIQYKKLDVLTSDVVKLKTSFINNLFEKNSSLNFSNGIIFELRNADKILTEINGIDLAIIARFPETIQKFFYNQLLDSKKEQLKKLDDKTPFTIDTKLLEKIKTIKNIKTRNKLYRFYSIVLAPLVEVSLLNKIFYAKTDDEKIKLKKDFLNRHKDYRVDDDKIKEVYEINLNSLLNSVTDSYNKIYDKTHCKIIADLSLTILNIKYHKKWNRENVLKQTKNNFKKFLVKIVIGILLVATISVSNFVGPISQYKGNSTTLYSNYVESYSSHLKFFDNVFDVNYDDMSENEIYQTKQLETFVENVIKENGEENYYKSLLEIRGAITNPNTKLMPTISDEDYEYMEIWKSLITYVDKSVAHNIDDIEKQLGKDLLLSAYSDDEIEYLKIYGTTDRKELCEIINSDKDLMYRFYAYMIFKANGYQAEDGEFSTLLNKDNIYSYWQQKYIFINETKSDFNFYNVENSFQWQTLCGMSNFILDAKQDYGYILSNGRIVEEEEDSDGINAMAKSNLLYAHVKDSVLFNANSSPVLVAIHEMAHRQQFNTFGYNKNTMETYAYTVEAMIAKELNIDFSYSIASGSLLGIDGDVENHDLGEVIVETTKKVIGIDNLNLLQESIIEYVNRNGDKTDYKKNMVDDIVNILINKYIDQQIDEGKIKEEDRKNTFVNLYKQFYKFEDFFSPYINSSNVPTELNNFLKSSLEKVTNYTEFYSSLLDIRKELINLESDYIPTILDMEVGYIDTSNMTEEDLFKQEKKVGSKKQEVTTINVNTWKKIINMIDDKLSSDINFIEKDSQLYNDLVSVYGYNNIEYLKVKGFRNNQDELMNIVKSNKDIKYRFYAYMFLNNSNREKVFDSNFKQEIVQYLKDYDASSIDFTQPNNSCEWSNLCGMVGFIMYGDDFSVYFNNVINNSVIVKNDASGEKFINDRQYVYNIVANKLKDTTTNPILLAAYSDSILFYKNISHIVNELDLKDDLRDLYLDFSLINVAQNLSIDLHLKETSVGDINDIKYDTKSIDIAKWLVLKTDFLYDENSPYLLQESVINYLKICDSNSVVASNILYEIKTNSKKSIDGITVVSKEEFIEIVSKLVDKYKENPIITKSSTKGLDREEKSLAKITNQYLTDVTDEQIESILDDFIKFVNGNVEKYTFDETSTFDKMFRYMIDDYSNRKFSITDNIKSILIEYVSSVVDKKGIISEEDKENEVSNIVKQILDVQDFTGTKIFFQDGKKYILTLDTPLVQKIKNINNTKLRKRILKIYSVFVAPIVELPIIDKLFNLKFINIDDKEYEKEKDKFLKGHKEYNKLSEDGKQQFNKELDSIIKVMKEKYEKVYSKTRIKSLSIFSAKLVGLKKHKQINKEYFTPQKQKENLTVGQKIKKYTEKFFIIIAIILGLSFGITTIISPSDFTTMVSSTGYAISNIDFSSQHDYYMGLLDTKIEWKNSYVPSMDNLYYKYVWKYQLYQMENQIADGINVILEDGQLTSKLYQTYNQDEIGYLKILAQRKDNNKLKEIINNEEENRFYRFYAHMLLNANGYKEQENEFYNLFDKEEVFKWIKQTDSLKNEVTDFEWQVKCYVAEHVLDFKITSNYIKRFARVIKTGESDPNVVAMSDLSYGDISLMFGVWATAAHEDGHNDMFNKLFVLNALAPMSINELYAYSSERAFALMAGISDGIYSRDNLISVNNKTEEHDAGRAVITTVRDKLGDEYYDLVRQSIIEYYYTVPLKSSVRQQTIDILEIFTDKVISKKIKDNKISEEDRQQSYDKLLKDLINYTGYFTGYLNISSQNVQIKMLSEYIMNKSNSINNEQEFFRTLLEIRKEMLSQESNFIPTLENRSYLTIWNLVLNKIDETVIANLDQIKLNKDISNLLSEVYTEDELEYLKIYVLQFSQSTDNLISVVKSNKDLKYRFYAYMLLGNRENVVDLINKEEVVKYLLNEYNPSDTDFSKINSSYEWKTLCGMTGFIMNDNYNSQFSTILNTAMIIGDNGSIADEYLLGTGMTAEEKREIRLDKESYLDSLSTKENYTYNNVKEIYSKITDNPILLSVISNSLTKYKKYNFSSGIVDVKNELNELYVYINILDFANKLSIDLSINTEYLKNIYSINEGTDWLSIARLMIEKAIECNDVDLFLSAIPKYIENLDAQNTVKSNMLMSVYSNMLKKDITSKEELLEILKQSIDEYISNGKLTTTNTKGMDATDKAETKITNNYISKSDQLVNKEVLLLDFFNFISSNIDNMDSKYIVNEKISYKDYVYSMISNYLEQDKTKQDKISEMFDVYINELVLQDIEQEIITEKDRDLQLQDYKTICTSDTVYNKNQKENNENSSIFNIAYIISSMALLVGFVALLKEKIFSNKLSFETNKKQQVLQIFEEISADKIDVYINETKSKTDLLYKKVFVINGNIDENIKSKINLKPLGVKVSGKQVYIGDNENSIFVYADDSNFDDIVNVLKNNSLLNKKIVSNIGIEQKYANIMSVKISNGLNKNDIEINNDLITISQKYDGNSLIEILSSYVDVMTRQGFVVKENLYRYVDDININLSKEERKQAFIDILQEQMTTQLIIDYNIFTQLQQDFGYEIFKNLTNQLKEKNIRLYVCVSNENNVKDLVNNEFISGYIMFDKTDFENVNSGAENKNIVCKIFDNLTFDSFEATFVAQENSNTCNKIIDTINSNVFKQPLIFRDSSIKQAVNNQRDTIVYNNFKSIFSVGKLTNILSNLKSTYNSKKFISTYKISELAESFDKDDINSLLDLYEKYFNKDKEIKSYTEFINILSKCESLKKFFNVSDLSKINNLDSFIENIVFRIKVADVLKDQGKEIGLKNTKYEDVLAKALKIKFVNNIEDTEIDSDVSKLLQIQNEVTKEQTLKKYIDDNIMSLTQRSFNNEQPDSIAINTIIFLMPYAEVADIEIDVNDMLDNQHDLRLTKSILSAA